MKEILLLSLASASISLTVTEMHIFSWLRKLMQVLDPTLGKLFHCGYCFSHYVILALCIIYKPRLFISDWEIIDYILTFFALQWLTAMQWAVISTILTVKDAFK